MLSTGPHSKARSSNTDITWSRETPRPDVDRGVNVAASVGEGVTLGSGGISCRTEPGNAAQARVVMSKPKQKATVLMGYPSIRLRLLAFYGPSSGRATEGNVDLSVRPSAVGLPAWPANKPLLLRKTVLSRSHRRPASQ